MNLKKARLANINQHKGFTFHHLSIADRDSIFALEDDLAEVTHVVNLAAQAGVRYSLINPYTYVETNVMGMVVMMEPDDGC